MTRPTLVLGLASILLMAAGCAGAGPSTAPSPTGSPPLSAAPSVEGEDPVVATACLTLTPEDCAVARDAALATLTADDPAVIYVQVGPFGCATGDRCPETLAARPEGDVTIEFVGATADNVHVIAAADGSLAAERAPGFGIAVEPSSAVGLAAGPQPFTLGHCGIFSGIDADGSWWDPVGPVEMDSGDAVNATVGVLNLTDPTHGTFVAPSGFAIQLERRDGAKVLPPCM
jgi:hypothetical protein